MSLARLERLIVKSESPRADTGDCGFNLTLIAQATEVAGFGPLPVQLVPNSESGSCGVAYQEALHQVAESGF